ncbi:MAG: tetratricopeptide repeat protein [Rhizomicrobium sp.]
MAACQRKTAGGDIGGARNILQALARSEPGLAAVHYELGLLLCSTGDTEGAIAAFSRVVALEPAHPDAWRDLGDQLSKADKLDEARSAYAKHFETTARRYAKHTKNKSEITS